jgi:hypothetical protein
MGWATPSTTPEDDARTVHLFAYRLPVDAFTPYSSPDHLLTCPEVPSLRSAGRSAWAISSASAKRPASLGELQAWRFT